MGSDRLGSGSLAAILALCNRLSRQSFRLPICSPFPPVMTGTAMNTRSFRVRCLVGVWPAGFLLGER
jgi:hypothetical protein